MKTYVLTLSKVFPSTHRRKGEQTLFENAFNAGQGFGSLCYSPKLHTIRANYWPYYMFQDGSSYRIKEIDTKWHIIPNIDELKWINVHTDEDHCYSCELFDRKNNMCKCITLCKDPHNTYKGFYAIDKNV